MSKAKLTTLGSRSDRSGLPRLCPVDRRRRGPARGLAPGPESPYASTLRARYPLRAAGRHPMGRWRPGSTNPVFGRRPARTFIAGNSASRRRPRLTGLLGIRRLWVRRDYLEFDLKRCGAAGRMAARAVGGRNAWHEALMAPLVENPSDETVRGQSCWSTVVARLTAGVELARNCAGWRVGRPWASRFWSEVDGAGRSPPMPKFDFWPSGSRPGRSRAGRLGPAVFCEVGDAGLFRPRVAGFPQPTWRCVRQNLVTPAEAPRGLPTACSANWRPRACNWPVTWLAQPL